MTYAEALAHARTVWHTAVVWVSYDGQHCVGRIVEALSHNDVYSGVLETLGEGPTWPDAFNSVEIEP